MLRSAAALGMLAFLLQPAGDQVPLPAFADVTAAAGIRFKHNNGSFGKKYLPETMGSGCAFFDADGDGRQDILLVNGMNWPAQAGRPATKSVMALYRNDGNGTFTDVTERAGLAVPMYGFGVAAGDYDNDGRTDLYVTALGANRLFRNLGGLRFEDVTAKTAVGDPGFSTSAAWLDYDRDGRLDLFVANYVEWTIGKDLFCTLDGKTKSYCTPESYKGQSSTLYRNRGDGTFENATKPAGLLDPTAKALGVALIDFNDDGWIDLFVANDTQPNRLYENKKNGTFNDVGVAAGVAFNEAGVARAGMGVDAADYDGSGRQSLVIGNFSNEMMALYTNEGNGLFIDEAPPSTIGRASLLTLTFACFFFDFDLDGRLDIFAANGHVADDVNAVQPRVTYAQPPHLFRNLGKRQFEAVTARVGAAMTRPMVARGAAYGDYDNDGDLDLLVTTNNGPARLLRNDGAPSPPQGGSGRAGGPRNNWLRVQAVGTVSNRDAIGTSVRVTLAGGRPSAWALVKSGSSYCSQSELPLTFGLGRADRVDKIEVKWPNGRTQTLPGTRANQTVTVEELRDSTRSAGQ
ncbi:MAG: CRTAC1 family protein [Vicinamibacterales bacterium]